MSDGDEARRRAVILDYLPHGGPGGGGPAGESTPHAQAVGIEEFRLFELDLVGELSIADEVSLRPPDEAIGSFREIGYEDLTSGATSELEYVIDELVTEYPDRFLEIFNEAQPITLRLHQLDLLPGIGEKLRNNILDERKRGPFSDFVDLEERIDGLHNAEEIIIDRILEEMRSDDLKYALFVAGSQ